MAAKKNKYTPEFLDLWELKPKRAGGNPKPKAQKALTARIKEGEDFNEIKAGLIRYAEFCKATGKIGTEFIMQLSTFFGNRNEAWNEDWDIPVNEKTETIEQKGIRLQLPAKVGESMAAWERRIAQSR